MNRVLFLAPFDVKDIEKRLRMTKKQVDAIFDYMQGKKITRFSYCGTEMTFEEFLKNEVEE